MIRSYTLFRILNRTIRSKIHLSGERTAMITQHFKIIIPKCSTTLDHSQNAQKNKLWYTLNYHGTTQTSNSIHHRFNISMREYGLLVTRDQHWLENTRQEQGWRLLLINARARARITSARRPRQWNEICRDSTTQTTTQHPASSVTITTQYTVKLASQLVNYY